MDERDCAGLAVILADPFTFENANPANRIAVGRHDAADLLVAMHHDGADAVTTSIDEMLGGGQAVAAVGWTTRVSKYRALPGVRAFAHQWHGAGVYLSSVRAPDLSAEF